MPPERNNRADFPAAPLCERIPQRRTDIRINPLNARHCARIIRV
jgi:hypothetical protein